MTSITIGKGEQPVVLLGKYGNRHGLVAGATGTGKTVSLMMLAEGFSRMGVPVFMADVKGDVAGLAVPGTCNDAMPQRRRTASGSTATRHEPSPVVFWDLYGKPGHPVRTTVSEIGPDAAGAHPRAERHADRRARHRVQAGRRPRPAAARPGRPARAARPASPTRARRSRRATVWSARSRSAPSSARCCRSSASGGDRFFGEPALELADLHAHRPRAAAASSTSWPPIS